MFDIWFPSSMPTLISRLFSKKSKNISRQYNFTLKLIETALNPKNIWSFWLFEPKEFYHYPKRGPMLSQIARYGKGEPGWRKHLSPNIVPRAASWGVASWRPNMIPRECTKYQQKHLVHLEPPTKTNSCFIWFGDLSDYDFRPSDMTDHVGSSLFVYLQVVQHPVNHGGLSCWNSSVPSPRSHMWTMLSFSHERKKTWP